jgi:imidazole glycerol-phosphate synthase subunit HisF
MLKKRLIPCLFLKNGFLARSEQFKQHQMLGDAIHQVERFNAWDVDELIYIDISEDEEYDTGRRDLKTQANDNILAILEKVAKTCFIPLTFGGKIRTMEDIHARISRGADKVTLNTIALENPGFIAQAAESFGSQAIIVSIDVRRHPDGSLEVFRDHGRQPTGRNPIDWAKEAEKLGAGEIFLNAIDRDGMANGYDIDLIARVAQAVNIPVIACGGIGRFEQMATGITEGHADAVAAGNIFHFTELSARRARQTLLKMGINVRSPS